MPLLARVIPLQVLILVGISFAFGAQPSVQEIVNQSIEKNERNWSVASQYAFTERDVVTENGKVTERTFKVLMIEGSPYNQLIAEDNEPLPQPRFAAEEEKLEQEVARRRRETPSARQERIAAYENDRQEEHTLMREMGRAFDFKYIGEEQLNGHNCYVLEATPHPGYRATSNETKVLTGMRGKMWIDIDDYQWVKVQAQVFRPVAIGLFIAHVQPGTEFILEQAPVENGVWLPTRFVTEVRATALMFWSKKYSRSETYSNYRHIGAAERASREMVPSRSIIGH
jgi:hypothetical protein